MSMQMESARGLTTTYAVKFNLYKWPEKEWISIFLTKTVKRDSFVSGIWQA